MRYFKRQTTILIVLLSAFLIQGCAKKPSLSVSEKPLRPVPALKEELDRVFSDSSFSNAFWGIFIQSIDNGEILYQTNPEKLFMPASTMKLITAAAALHYLKPDFHFQTTIETDGQIAAGTLQGNLLIRGTGDPSISGRSFNGDSLHIFNTWAQKLKDLGIQQVSGDVIGLDDYFDDERLGPGWSWDDLNYDYAAEVSALQFNENSLTVTVTPDGVKSIDPDTHYMRLVNHLVWGSENEKKTVHWERQDNTIVVEGTIPRGQDDYGTFAVPNPAAYFVEVFRETLERNGIHVTGESYRARDRSFVLQKNATILLTYDSPPLSDIISVMLKVSQNLYAETLLKTIGRVTKQEGSFDAGKKSIEEFLTHLGVSSNSYVLADGSGLSRYNYVSPELLIKVLRAMRSEKYFQTFFNALSIAGADGTLKQRMIGTRAAGNVHAKTGSIENVRSLAGYVTTRDGELIAFVILVNNFNTPRESAEYLQDLTLERLANFSRK